MLLGVLVCVLTPACFALEDYEDTDSRGSLERCRRKLSLPSGKLKLLSNIVGIGWDNLRNLPMASVYETTFYKCKTTPDSMYLVPDNMIVLDVKQSHLDSVASFYESFQDYFHATTDSVNIEVSANAKGASVAGSFNKEHQDTKQKSVAHSSSIMRTKLEYHAYTVILQPNSKLSSGYRQRLTDIDYYLRTGRYDMATYAAQVLVRDFGTHVIKRAKVGAEVSRNDYIDMSVVNEAKSSLDEIKAEASVNFRDQYKMKMEASHKKEDKTSKGYTSSLRHSETRARGGPNITKLIRSFVIESANISGAKGADSALMALDDIVALDRSGEPLYLMISHRDIEGFNVLDGAKVASELKNATMTYFQKNTRSGCMDPKSGTFDYFSNINESEKCMYPRHNYSFGGIYQECYAKVGGNWKKADELGLCVPYNVINGISGAKECPVYYKQILIWSVTDINYKVVPERKGERPWWKSMLGVLTFGILPVSREYVIPAYTEKQVTRIDTYSCEADPAMPPIPERSGYMFGGVYTSTQPNPFTGSASCPGHFRGIRLAFNITVCVSRNYDLDHRYAVDFGGFFSCFSSFNIWRCPDGYTQYFIVTIISTPLTLNKCHEGNKREWCRDWSLHQSFETQTAGCEVYFCAKAADFPEYKLMNAQRPPFMDAPGVVEAAKLFEKYIKEVKEERVMTG